MGSQCRSNLRFLSMENPENACERQQKNLGSIQWYTSLKFPQIVRAVLLRALRASRRKNRVLVWDLHKS